MATRLRSQDSLDYAKCPYCEHSTPIQQSNLSLSGEYRRWTGTDGVPEFFLCSGCKRIVGFPAEGLTPRLASDGLWPTREDARPRVYQLPIECGEKGCVVRGVLHIAWSLDRGDEPDAKTSKDWIANDFRCPQGHPFSFPWR